LGSAFLFIATEENFKEKFYISLQQKTIPLEIIQDCLYFSF